MSQGVESQMSKVLTLCCHTLAMLRGSSCNWGLLLVMESLHNWFQMKKRPSQCMQMCVAQVANQNGNCPAWRETNSNERAWRQADPSQDKRTCEERESCLLWQSHIAQRWNLMCAIAWNSRTNRIYEIRMANSPRHARSGPKTSRKWAMLMGRLIYWFQPQHVRVEVCPSVCGFSWSSRALLCHVYNLFRNTWLYVCSSLFLPSSSLERRMQYKFHWFPLCPRLQKHMIICPVLKTVKTLKTKKQRSYSVRESKLATSIWNN